MFLTHPENNPNDPLLQYFVGYSNFDPADGTTGFAENLNPRDENQVRHLFAGLAGGNARGGLGELGMYTFELWQDGAPEDMRLYTKAFALVQFLVGNPALPLNAGHPLSDASNWVMENLTP